MRLLSALASSALSMAIGVGLIGTPGRADAADPAKPPPSTTAAQPPPPAPSASGNPQAPPGGYGQPPPAGYGPPPGPATPGEQPPYGQYPYPYPYAYLPPPIPLIPPTLPYVEGRPIPNGYHMETRTNKPLLISGLSLFFLAYGISLGVGLVFVSAGGNASGEFAPLLVPLAGPFIALGTVKEASATMTLDGVTQSAGVLLAVIGAVATETILVRNDRKTSLATPELLVGPGSAAVRWNF
jgi:hypothetical protein